MTEPVPERLPAATPAEIEALWAQPPLEIDPDSPIFDIRDVYEIPAKGTYYFGKLLTGSLRCGQPVAVEGRAGYAEGTISRIGYGPDFADRASAGQYVTLEIVRLTHRAMVLDLRPGCRLYGR